MIKYSLIVATLGRKQELFEMLESIRNSDYELSEVEVIIVDQNDEKYIKQDVLNVRDININYIHSESKGLSLNRNLGLTHAKGEIICFPDDDCKFYTNTLSIVDDFFELEEVDFCMGRIFDRERKVDVIKRWPKKAKNIGKFNSYFLNSSVTLFVKRTACVSFDNYLGVGAKFGSCEDADFIYRILELGAVGVYTPEIEIWHPKPDLRNISLDKVESYASGFGYFVGKKTDTIKVVLFLLLLTKKTAQFLFFRNKFVEGYFSAFFRGLFKAK
ncbi:glycosyl transferase, group 2 family protein [Vibrio diabolicus E0666]|uniref:glycosyltransferase family 2 protein n=1 Tax=Vibrio diabolicus TaxID=50719 RepID=UPI0002B702E4|nr:glycosyltransferase family 2 protein [Vibrio diabolicus]EMD78540.1 glycosyl transferase, group 2 family protein [Vibrio diabolicus E0666]